MRLGTILLTVVMMFGSLLNIPKELRLKSPYINGIAVKKAIVYVTLAENSNATEYCFQYPGTVPDEASYDWLPITNMENNTFHCYKYDGEYDLYVRNNEHQLSNKARVVVNSGYHYTFDGNEMRILPYSLSTFLTRNNSSIEEMNRYIAKEVIDAGWQTREGVAIAALSTISFLADYGMAIPYQGFGAFQFEKNWGVNPAWGQELLEAVDNGTGPDYHVGMQCVGGCVWAFKQAGINLSNPNVTWQIGKNGETKYIGDYEWASDNIIDYRRARTGDLVQIKSHYRTILDRLDTDGDGVCESYLSFEMHKPGEVGYFTCRITPMYTVSYRDRNVFNMDNVYTGIGHQQNHCAYWKTTLIPDEALPQYIKEAILIHKVTTFKFQKRQ